MKYILLDDLTKHMGANYVSELKLQRDNELFLEYIKSIKEDAYTLDDWEDTCTYLTGISHNVKNVVEAKNIIFKWMKS